MINIERIEPFLTFQVTVENKENNTLDVLNIKSLSYETNGEYVTFFQKIVAREIVESPYQLKNRTKIKSYIKKLIELHKHNIEKDVLDELLSICDQIEDKEIVEHRKMPFLTLKNVQSIKVINTETDKFNLVEKVSEVYLPSQQVSIPNNNITSVDNQIFNTNVASKPISTPAPFAKKIKLNTHQESSVSKKQSNFENLMNNKDLIDSLNDDGSNNISDEIKPDINELGGFYQEEENPFSSNDMTETVEENPFESNTGEQDDNLMGFLDSFNDDNNQIQNDDHIDALLNGDYEQFYQQQSVDNELEHMSNKSELDDMVDDFNQTNLTDKEQEENQSKQKFQNSLTSILNRIENRTGDEENMYQSSVDERNNRSEKYKVIKHHLDEFLRITSAPFNIKTFYENFLKERVSQQLKITENDVIIQICNMIKHREITISKFFNKQIQSVIDKNKDVIQFYNDGDLNRLIDLLNKRSEETRYINMIDLAVYMRQNNYFK